MFPKKKELEYGSEEKRLAERKARKEKTVELKEPSMLLVRD